MVHEVENVYNVTFTCMYATMTLLPIFNNNHVNMYLLP